MSVIIISTGGGHKALEQLQHVSPSMTHEQRAQVQALLDEFVANVAALCADVT